MLRLAVWNANGISQRKNEIQTFLIQRKIDLMLISETHLTTKNCCYIKNYVVYDTKHPNNKGHGGSGILIRRGIKHHMHSTISKTYMQATSIVIEEWSGNCVLLQYIAHPDSQ